MRLLSAIVALLLLAGCELHVAEQELYARHDLDADSLELLLIYEQISHPPGKDNLEKATKILEKSLAGGRRFWIVGLLGAFDLEADLEELTPKQRELVEAVKFLDYGVYLDDEERLCGYQRITFPRATEGIAELNAAFSKHLIEEIEEGDLKEEDSPLDDRTYALIEERARSGKPWLRLIDGEFEFDLPFTRASWDGVQLHVQKELFEDMDEESGPWVAQMLGLLRHLEIGDERVILRFGSPDGLIRIRWVEDDPKYTHDLKKALEARGISFENLPTIEEIRAKIR